MNSHYKFSTSLVRQLGQARRGVLGPQLPRDVGEALYVLNGPVSLLL